MLRILLPVLFFLLHLGVARAAPDLLKLVEGESFAPDFVQTLAATPGSVIDATRDADGRTMLHLLATRSHQARFLVPLLRGADVNVRDDRGRTPLFDNLEASKPAQKGEDFMILEMLTVRGADLNARSNDGTTPLAIAVERGDYRRAEFLLWRGAQLHPEDVLPEKLPAAIARARGDQNMIGLFEAAVNASVPTGTRARTKRNASQLTDALNAADLAAIEDLIASGWSVNEQDDQGRTALFRAVENLRADLANSLLLDGADPNLPDKNGKTPLMMSILKLSIEGQRMSALLLLKGADIHAVANDGTTALVAAVSAGNDFSTLWMIAAGADPFAATPRGSLMKYAGHPPTAWLLKQFGLAPEAKAPETNRVAIMFEAVKRGDLASVTRALDAGIPPDAEYDVTRTALHWAVPYGKFDVIDLLLARGANINHQGRHTGGNYLHGLASWGGTGGGDVKVAADYIEKLIARGSNPNAAMKDGTTPLMIAAKEGLTGANTEALVKAGADLNVRNKEGLTALAIAHKFGRLEMVAFLKAHGAEE